MSDNYTKSWERIWEGDYGSFEDHLKKAENKVDIMLENGVIFDDGMKVFDGGCGDCTTLFFLKNRFNIEPFGIGISEVALNTAHKLNDVEEVGVTIKKADVREIPFEDGMFDVVLSFGVIEHFKDYDKAVDEFYRILKPGGKLVLIQPHKYSLRHIKKWWLKLRGKWLWGMQINFSGRRLGNILSEHKFKNINYFVKPHISKRGLINKLDYLLHNLNKGWGYHLYMVAEK